MLITTEAQVTVVVDAVSWRGTLEVPFDHVRLELHETVRREDEGAPVRPVRYLTLTIPLDEKAYGRALTLRDATMRRDVPEGER